MSYTITATPSCLLVVGSAGTLPIAYTPGYKVAVEDGKIIIKPYGDEKQLFKEGEIVEVNTLDTTNEDLEVIVTAIATAISSGTPLYLVEVDTTGYGDVTDFTEVTLIGRIAKAIIFDNTVNVNNFTQDTNGTISFTDGTTIADGTIIKIICT